ncbi:hypothetical protein [Agromyces sp. LHK192]|uniref:aggregation-promoting factor C-terminal-like domain-containing protein n=1 Tax=Agromyces sp. LHK192 TaxID=2498704 RepID=UPI001F0BFEF1|nr:hypothetical protein [Agromyces sp. LHK192]
MQNQISPETRTPQPAAQGGTRAERRAARIARNRYALAAGAVVAVGAVVGSGFAVDSAVAAQNDRVEATAAMTAAANPDAEQLGAHDTILDARAAKVAQDTLAPARDAITAASGKVDAAALTATVANLDDYEFLSPSRVFALAKQANEATATVQGQVAEFDRVAAEQAAAAAAAKAAEEAAAAAAAEAAESSSGTSTSSRPTGPANPSGAQAIARDLMLAQYGWGEDQFGCLVSLWNHESGWNVYASNGSSGAYGIPQALPGSKMASAGADWQTNPATQITWGLGYVAGRYGTPCGAWDSFNAKGWY